MLSGAYPGRISLSGSNAQLTPSQAAKLALLFSELAANAARYGALSSDHGKVELQWQLVVNGSRRLHFDWAEKGTSSLTIPKKIGRGTQLLAGTVENCVRDFHAAGMVCKFEFDCMPPSNADLRALSS